MPDKKSKAAKTPIKSEEVDPETADKNKESARKLAEELECKIPTVQSPARRVALINQFSSIKLKDLSNYALPAATDLLNKLDAETDAELVDPTRDIDLAFLLGVPETRRTSSSF